MVADTSNNGFGSPTTNIPHDWTEGTGVIPAGGSIIVPAPSGAGQRRKWFYVQNQSAVTISVIIVAFKADGITATTATILLASGGIVGTQGATQEFGGASWAVNSAITVSGAAGSQVCVLEVLQ